MTETFKKLLSLVHVCHKISGRKKFQKLVYILKHKGFEFNEDYTYYYYGPYSSGLQMEIDALVHSELLNEHVKGSTYEYCITCKANEYIKNYSYSEEQASFINMLNEQPVSILELVSVFYYLKGNGYAEKSSILNKTRILKPELVGYIDEAYNLFSCIEKYKTN